MLFQILTSVLALVQATPTTIFTYIDGVSNYYQITDGIKNPNDISYIDDVSFPYDYESYGVGNDSIINWYHWYDLASYSDLDDFTVGGSVRWNSNHLPNFPNTTAFDFDLNLRNTDYYNRPTFEIHHNHAEYGTNICYTLTYSLFTYDSFDVVYTFTYDVNLLSLRSGYERLDLTSRWSSFLASGTLQYCYLYASISWRLVDVSEYREDTYLSGYDYGSQVGYESGYDIGYADGYTIGSQGTETQFQNLFATIVDVPILYLRKLFGYELFGINLFYALTTVISLIVAFSVFRLVRGIF